MKISLLDLPAGTVCLNNLDPDGIPFAVFSFDGDSNSSLFYGSYHTLSEERETRKEKEHGRE